MTDIVERLKRVRYTRERGDGPNGTYFEEPCDADDADAVVSLINPDGPEAAAEIERLREAHEVTAADLHAWMKLKADAEARLAEAVEVVRGLMEWAEPLAGDNCDPLAASEETRSVEFARAFLAKMEPKRSEDIIREDRDEWDARLEGRS